MEENELTLSQYFSVIKKYYKKFILWVLIAVVACSVAFVGVSLLKKPTYEVSIQTKYDVFNTADASTESTLLTFYQKNQTTLIKNTLELYNKENDVSMDNKTFEKKITAFTKALSVEQETDNKYLFNISLETFDKNSEETSKKLFNCFLTVLENSINNLGGSISSTSSSDSTSSTVSFSYDDIKSLSTNYNVDKYLELDENGSYYDDSKQPIENLLNLYENVMYFKDSIKNVCNWYSIASYTKNDGSATISSINNKIEKNIIGSLSTKNSLEYILNNVIENVITDDMDKSDYIERLSDLNTDPYDFSTKYDDLKKASKYYNEDNDYVNMLIADINKMYPLNEIYRIKNQALTSADNFADKAESVSAITNDLKTSITNLIKEYNEIIDDYNDLLGRYSEDFKILEQMTDIKAKSKFSIKSFLLIDIVGAFIAFIVVYVVYFIKMKNAGDFDLENNKQIKE